MNRQMKRMQEKAERQQKKAGVDRQAAPQAAARRAQVKEKRKRTGARQFLRVHRSTLVNVDRIKTLKPSLYGDYSILLRDGTKLTLSRGFRETVLRRLGTA